MDFTPTDYILESVLSGKQYKDENWILEAPGEEGKTLIRSIYKNKQLDIKEELGLYRYADWLPIQRILEGSSAPVTYKSEGLAKELGLSNLWITYSGYWPEKGAMMKTCSFKETEAYMVCGRMGTDNDDVLIVASAGNTARSFARVCSDNNIPLLLVVPEDYLDSQWFDKPLNPSVKLIASKSGCDYFDAIHLSNIAAQIPGFIPEGGAKNVARREGMGTTVLSAATTIGKIPDYYFQAVGSSTGAVSAWEANLRLIEDGRFGTNKMKLMVSQNIPFTILKEAWDIKSRDLMPMDDDKARQDVEQTLAKVLTNRRPVYSIAGGLFDALSDTNGEVLEVENKEAIRAGEMFERLEGVDIHPAAAVATASLINAVKENKVGKDELIMLNITGGGEGLFAKENKLYYLKPDIIFDKDPNPEDVKAKVKALFRK